MFDLLGQHFGRLFVLKNVPNVHGRKAWLCECTCGRLTVVITPLLRSGKTKSCGCLHKEIVSRLKLKHGKTGTRVYCAWKEMKTRCRRKYVGRSIEVCDLWKSSFDAFYVEMGDCPSGFTLDRIDNTKGYEPGNCRWATVTQQARNTRRNVWLTYEGKTATVIEWAQFLGVSQFTLYDRIRRGWDVEDVLTAKRRHLSFGKI